VVCEGCLEAIRKDETGQAAPLRMLDGWWHRDCWLAGSTGRQAALESERAWVGRHNALAGYLMAQDEWGGLPAVLVGRPNLVPSSFQDAADNHC
jgi:hypothetical protein